MLKIICYTLAYLYAFWVLYVLIMGVYRAYLAKRLTPFMLILSAPFVIAGGVLDVVANLTIATIVCLEFPQEWLVTQRFIRYTHRPGVPTDSWIWKWRTGLAKYICDNLLDVFDPDGNHCEDLAANQASTIPVLKEPE